MALADSVTDAQKAWADAQATHNDYVITAVRAQLLKDHPEYQPWLTAAAPSKHAPPSRADTMTEPSTATFSTTTSTHAFGSTQAKYNGEIQAGFENDTGNTRNQSFNGKANLTRENEDWIFLGQGSVAYGASSGVANTENYRALAQANYKLAPEERWMTTFFWNSNRFTGFQDRYEEVTGLSNDWTLTPKLKLTTEVAGGAREIELTDRTGENEPILWLRGNLTWPISPSWTFTEDLRNSFGPRYTFIWSNTALTTPIKDKWKLRLSMEADDVTNPPLHREPLDTISLVSLVYGF